MEKNEMELQAGLAKKLLTVASEIGILAKDGRNDQQRYDFVSYEQLNAKLRDILPKHGVALIPSIDSVTERDLVSAKGAPYVRAIVQGKMTIVDAETGYAMTMGFAGADNDTAGKATGKAITEAVKRFEMKLFHTSTKDDADPDYSGFPGDQQGYSQGGHAQNGGYKPQPGML